MAPLCPTAGLGASGVYLAGGIGVSVIAHLQRLARARERERAAEVARNEELLAAQNHELQQQGEELAQQNEELQQQSEELSQQNEELAQQAEELERQQQELRRERGLLSSVMRGTDVMLVYLDADFNFIWVNEAYAQGCRMRSEEMVGKNHFALYPHAENESIFRRVRETGEGVFYKDKPFEFSDQPERGVTYWDWSLTPVKDDRGKVAGLVFSLRETTKYKRSELALAESEQRFRTMADAITQLAWIANADGWIHWYNRRWYEYTGTTPQDMEGWGWQSVHDPNALPAVLEQWKASIATGEPFDMTFPLRGADGVFRPFLTRGQPLKDSQGRVVQWFGTNTEVGELQRTQEQLVTAKLSAERARAEAERASQAKDQFLAILSHELRNPLSPVVATVSLLRKNPRLDAETHEALEVIHRNAEMEARLIDDLLDVTRITRGKVELDKRPVELCMIIQRAVEVCMPDIEARKLHFGVEMDGGAPFMVHADAARLQQVFWNLLKNAVKFTPESGCVGVRCRLESAGGGAERRVLSAESGPGRGESNAAQYSASSAQCSGCGTQNATLGLQHWVVVEVNDSGVGIEAEAMPRIFDAFEQGERSRTRQFGGLGLGLTISKAMVEMHGGTISAQSDGKDKGATFIVRLPLASVGSGQLAVGGPDAPQLPTVKRQPPTPLRILLVEDHGDTAKIMRQLLMMDGHTVERAGDVATALEMAERGRFDLLLSDLGLPDRSGLELMQELRARGHVVPGIALSGYGQEQDIQRSREAGFAAHLTKPTSPERLAEAIGAVTGRGNDE